MARVRIEPSLMISITLALLAYNIPAQPTNYNLRVKFEGMIPILGGTEQGRGAKP